MNKLNAVLIGWLFGSIGLGLLFMAVGAVLKTAGV